MPQPHNVPDIPLHLLDYRFTTPPLLIGGMAMEYYDLRVSGADIDFVATRADYADLAALHPDHLKDLHGDLGVCVGPFEVWTSICLFDYDALAIGALDCGAWRVIALEKLLLLKCLGMEQPKNAADVRLIAQRILDIQYGKATGAI
jgi:hypothetical protein